jgi:hypothetical protein
MLLRDRAVAREETSAVVVISVVVAATEVVAMVETDVKVVEAETDAVVITVVEAQEETDNCKDASFASQTKNICYSRKERNSGRCKKAA